MSWEQKNENEAATEKVMRARAELIQQYSFYGVLVSNVHPEPSRQVPTMATNGKTHYFNPAFVNNLTQDEVVGVQAHESEHDARKHHLRRGDRDPRLWNIACDYAINGDLIAAGFTLPKGALIDDRYTGMSSENIYRILENESPEKPQPTPGGGEGQDGQQQGGQQQGQQGGQGAGQDQDQDHDAKASGGAGRGNGQAGANGAANGTANPKAPQSHGDPGGCGEVLDGEPAPGETQGEAEAQWDRIVQSAASLAKGRGDLPGHMVRELEQARAATQDWREVLRTFYDQGAMHRETWSRPNRRHAGKDYFLPSTKRYGINRAVMVVDTSGSMDTKALASIVDETQSALDSGVLDHLTVIYIDTQIARIDEYAQGDQIKRDAPGGGGTTLYPAFAHIENEINDASVIVCFTDGIHENLNAHEQPTAPVLFAYYGHPLVVANKMKAPPWESIGIDAGA